MIAHRRSRTSTVARFPVLGLAAALVLAACGGGEESAPGGASGDGDGQVEQATLRLITAWPETDKYQTVGLSILKEEVDELSGGQMQIEVIGGPEAIAPFDQAAAVRDGAVDMAWNATSYYVPEFPEGAILAYSTLTAAEERESGARDYLNDLHQERMGSLILGRGGVGSEPTLYTQDPVTKVGDFAGRRLRVAPVYVPFVEALGAEPVTMPAGELYTALERGVIDGFAWPSVGISALQLHEITGYQILPKFWRADMVSIINQDAWESLSEEQQNVLVEAAKAVEEGTPAEYERLRAEELPVLEANGVEQAELSPAEAEKFLDLAESSSKDWIREYVDGDAEKLIEQFSK